MTNWTDIDLSGDPRMLLGRRTSSKRLDLQHVEVDQNLFEDLRAIARSALEELDRRDAKPYSEFGHATADDYFETDVSDLPMRRDRRKRDDDPQALQPASALNMTTGADAFPSLDAEELRDFEASLYVLAFEDGDGGYTCFVRKQSPRRPLKPGLRFLQFGDTLRKVEPPDLAIDEEVDLVLTTGRCAILNVAAFESIFGDVRVAFGNLPANMTAIQEPLGDVVPLSETSLEALQARCARRITDAKRLHRLVEEKSGAIAALTKEEFESLFERHGLDVLKDGELALDDSRRRLPRSPRRAVLQRRHHRRCSTRRCLLATLTSLGVRVHRSRKPPFVDGPAIFPATANEKQRRRRRVEHRLNGC